MDAEMEHLAGLHADLEELERHRCEAEEEIDRLKEDFHEAGSRNGKLVLELREKDLVIDTMNEAHKLLMAEKDALITELCDALEDLDPGYDRIKKLIQQGSEATR